MRILLVTEFFPKGKDLKFSGGVEARTYFVAKYLAKRHEIHVIATRQKGSKKFEKLNGINVHRVGPTITYNEISQISQIPKKLSFVISSINAGSRLNPEIVEGANYIGHLIAKQISKRNKIKAIFWYPDVFIGNWITNAGLAGMFGWGLEKFNLLQSADHFIAISQVTSEKLIKNNIPQEKIDTIPCGVDLSEFSKRSEKSDHFTILCISRLVRYKRVDDLIKAFSKVLTERKNIDLVIIGNGPEKNRLENMCSMLKIKNNVTFLENLARDDLINRLKMSHLFCLPSQVEGFGIAIIEAAAAGIPFVISNLAVFKEITQNGQGGLFYKVGDIRDLEKKLKNLMDNKKLYQRKSEEALNLAKNYQWQQIAQDTENIYIRSQKTQRS